MHATCRAGKVQRQPKLFRGITEQCIYCPQQALSARFRPENISALQHLHFLRVCVVRGRLALQDKPVKNMTGAPSSRTVAEPLKTPS